MLSGRRLTKNARNVLKLMSGEYGRAPERMSVQRVMELMDSRFHTRLPMSTVQEIMREDLQHFVAKSRQGFKLRNLTFIAVVTFAADELPIPEVDDDAHIFHFPIKRPVETVGDVTAYVTDFLIKNSEFQLPGFKLMVVIDEPLVHLASFLGERAIRDLFREVDLEFFDENLDELVLVSDDELDSDSDDGDSEDESEDSDSEYFLEDEDGVRVRVSREEYEAAQGSEIEESSEEFIYMEDEDGVLQKVSRQEFIELMGSEGETSTSEVSDDSEVDSE